MTVQELPLALFLDLTQTICAGKDVSGDENTGKVPREGRVWVAA